MALALTEADALSTSSPLDAAHHLLDEADRKGTALVGKTVQVVRAYVFTGPYEQVKRQLERSQGPGTAKTFSGLTIACFEGDWVAVAPAEAAASAEEIKDEPE